MNESQNFAVQMAIEHKLSCIQGPPGTGKTTVAAHIVKHLSKHYSKKGSQILVTATSNFAIDNLVLKMMEFGISPLSVYAKAR